MTDPLEALRSHPRRVPPALDDVVQRGVQRRRREILAAVLSLAVAAGVAGFAVTVRSGAPRAVDTVTTRPAPGVTSGAVTATPSTSATGERVHVPVESSPRAGGRVTPAAPRRPSASAAVAPSASATTSPASTSEVAMRREYDPDGAEVSVGGGRLCTTRVGVAGGQDPYCASGRVDRVGADNTVHLVDEMCMDAGQPGRGQLRFRSEREVDFAVYDGPRLVWRWSAGRPPPEALQHELAVEPGRCWVWSTTWHAVDAQGRRLAGDFTLRTFSYATELEGTPYAATDEEFTL